METAARRFQEYRIEFLGGAARAVLKNTANPTSEDVRDWTSSFFAVTPDWISSFGGHAGIMVGRTVFGIIIFVVTMYFLFADGPRIAKQLMTLSPLEDRYVEKLLAEFSRVSRAVVSGSVAAALMQSLLAGVGFQSRRTSIGLSADRTHCTHGHDPVHRCGDDLAASQPMADFH